MSSIIKCLVHDISVLIWNQFQEMNAQYNWRFDKISSQPTKHTAMDGICYPITMIV